jgi:hypothetical protein
MALETAVTTFVFFVAAIVLAFVLGSAAGSTKMQKMPALMQKIHATSRSTPPMPL